MHACMEGGGGWLVLGSAKSCSQKWPVIVYFGVSEKTLIARVWGS